MISVMFGNVCGIGCIKYTKCALFSCLLGEKCNFSGETYLEIIQIVDVGDWVLFVLP